METWEVAQIKNTVEAHCKDRHIDFINGKTNPYTRTEHLQRKQYNIERNILIKEMEK